MPNRRQKSLDALRSNFRFDVVVVGGGVNGIGVYRDLALQGLRVLLVERNDFCSGCSAAPSRMIHGGLRYLENGEFGLVKESLQERDTLLRVASHMVHPLPTVIPVASRFSGLWNAAASFVGSSRKPSARGALPVKLGLAVYEFITRKRQILPRHHFNNQKETRSKWPDLTSKAKYSAVFHDAWISHPERLCIEMICDVQAAAPACIALNYAELEANGDQFIVRCKRTGVEIDVAASAIVNASGAWLDSTARMLGEKEVDAMVSGTKGSHLIIDSPELKDALKGHMVYFENDDGRVCIAFPYLGKVLAGSTDIRVNKACRVRCEQEELDYILDSLRLVFPNIAVAPSQVVFSFSGIRPLPKSEHSFTGRIPRDHLIRVLDGATPQFCMVGGKWTTFRAFAEQASDAVLKHLKLQRRTETSNLPIGGGSGFDGDTETLERDLSDEFGISLERARHLVEHYGTKAKQVCAFCAARKSDQLLAPNLHYTHNEIAFLIHHERVETLSDIVLRRTSLAITGDISLDIINVLVGILAEEAGLEVSDVKTQRQVLIDELSDYHGVSMDVLKLRNHSRSKQCA